MVKYVMRSLKILIASVLVVAFLAGCNKLKTEGWDAETFYINAKEQLDKRKWTKAIELFQQLEARYPYGEYAEQAQLEIAYAYYKNNDQAEALAAADRFIRLHPTHPSVDYAYYLKGLVNFTENKTTMDKLLGGKDFSDRDPNSA